MLKAVADPLRLRILLVLMEKEMCVCQIMAILSVSQPMVSRSLAILQRVGLVKGRKEKKLKFYSLNDEMAEEHRKFVELLKEALWDDETAVSDRKTVVECTEFQKRTGRCDMKILKEFMEKIKGGTR